MFTQMRSNLKFLGSILFVITFLVGGFFVVANKAYAETLVSGNITTDTTWTLANSPYNLTGTIQVEAKITIEPGVVVNFNDGSSLNITSGSSGSIIYLSQIPIIVITPSTGAVTVIQGADLVPSTSTLTSNYDATGLMTTVSLSKEGTPVNFDSVFESFNLATQVGTNSTNGPYNMNGSYSTFQYGPVGGYVITSGVDQVTTNTGKLLANAPVGIYTITSEVKSGETVVASSTYIVTVNAPVVIAPTITLSGIPATVTTETAATEDGNGVVTGFTVGNKTPIQVTLTKGSADYSNVRVVVTGLISGVQLIAQSTTGTWYNIAKTGWGDPAGFSIATVTTPVYLVANTAGTYNTTIQLVDVSNNNAVLASTTASVIANAPVTPVIMTVNTTVPEFTVGVPATFTVGTIANSDAGKIVKAHFAIPTGVTVEYQEGGQGAWIQLVDVYGPSTGFPLGDITSTFRGTFTEAGTKTVKVDFIEVGTNNVLGSKNITTVVVAPVITSDTTAPTAVAAISGNTITYTFSEPVQLVKQDTLVVTLLDKSLLGIYNLTAYMAHQIGEDAPATSGSITDATLTNNVLTITYTGTLPAGSYIVDAWGYNIQDLASNKIAKNDVNQVFTAAEVDTIAPVITAFTIPNQVGTTIIDESAKTIAVTMPYGTDVTALVPTITTTGVSISPASGVVNNFTHLIVEGCLEGALFSATTGVSCTGITYIVTAADGSTQNYVVTVTVASAPASSTKAITSFTIPSQAGTTIIDEVAKTITVNVPFGTDVTALVPTFTITGDSINVPLPSLPEGCSEGTLFSATTGVACSTIQVSGTTANDFTNLIIYNVTAGDGSTQNYVVTITVAAPVPTLTLVTPIGGEKYKGGDSVTISWTSTDSEEFDSANPVSIGFNPNPTINPNNWTTLVSSQPSTGSYSWTVPNVDTTNGQIMLMASDKLTHHYYPASGTFSIDSTVPTATVSYNVTTPTNGSVIATITPNETVVGDLTYTFTANGLYTFNFTDLAGNAGSVDATVSNIDVTKPVITIGSYIATPTNQDITVNATTDKGTLNASSNTFTTNGSFDFVATDTAGNVTTKTVTISNIDKVLPVITVLGTNSLAVAYGSVYTDAGATATDNVDGNITTKIVTVNPVNTSIAGTYTITYNVVDLAGNHSLEITRTVTVNNRPSSGGGSRSATPAVPATKIEGCKPGSGDLFDITSGKSCTVSATPAIPGKVLGAENFNFTKVMRNNSKGNEIIELQKFLTTLGYTLTADGNFGPKTKAAVIKFQIANNLVGDGVVGALTRAALNK